MVTDSRVHATATTARDLHDPTYQAFILLRSAFTVAPVLFGLDKFFNVMTDWSQYLAPWNDKLVPGTAHQAMLVVASSRSQRESSSP